MKKQGKAIILGVSALAISSVAGLAGAHDVSATEKDTKISTAYEQLFEGVNPGEASKVETVGDYTYKATLKVTDENCVYEEVYSDPGAYIQIGIQEWGQDMSEMEVLSMEAYDKSGNLMATFDGTGKITVASTAPMRAGAAAAEAPAAVAAEPASDVAAATAGDTTAAVTSSKGSPDTGIADVAAIAGIAVVAAGAIVVAKKRG